jgi:broad specificity phosphatase PhoE
MEDSLRTQNVKHNLETLYPNKEFEFIGSGFESAVFTDGKYIYKFFDNEQIKSLLLIQLVGRFKNSKRLFDIEEVTDINELCVLKYIYKESNPYTGGRKEEVIEFLVECWERGIVHWDVKPLNFRVFEDGLRLIDYGYDIKPFNYKDFIFMVQRAYLMLNYSDNDNFKPLVREALINWDLAELHGFREFFNEVYSRILSIVDGPLDLPQIVLFDDEMLYEQVKNMCSQFQSVNKMLFYSLEKKDLSNIFPKKDIVHITNISELSPSEKYDLAIIDIRGKVKSASHMCELLTSISKKLEDDCECAIIVDNPFYNNEHDKYPLLHFKNSLLTASLIPKKVQETKWQINSSGEFYSQYLITIASANKDSGNDVSLLIKTCYQDGPFIERLIRHIVSQLEGPDRFLEKIVVIDTKENDFLRQYCLPYKEMTLKAVEKLAREGFIDKFLLAPTNEKEIRNCNKRWFNIDTETTHSITNVPVFPQVYAFEQCKGDYILQVDSDAIIVRRERDHSFLEDMKTALKENINALSVSFNIAHSATANKNKYSSPGNGHYVPEVRFGLLDRKRFFDQRPYPNELIHNHLKLTWYRSAEKAQCERDLVSLRGGDPRTFYIHPPNAIKINTNSWFFVIDQAEQNNIPDIQYESVDLIYDFDRWNIPIRNEPFIFVICGRNIPTSRFLRCWQSVIGQNHIYWGAIIIDDASDNCLHEFISFITAEHRDKVTFVRNQNRQGILANINNAIRNFCSDPNSVIIILDADDMLLSKDVLYNLNLLYMNGADMTVGTALRFDKGIMSYVPDFRNPRNIRGGDVWMHLRTFRKYLFDSIDENDFKKDGSWIGKFTELTYMVPIAEMAKNPVHIKFPVYLWQPSHVRDEEHYRKNQETVQFMLAKKAYSAEDSKKSKVLKPFCTSLQEVQQDEQIIFIRHAEKEQNDFSLNGESPDDLPLTNKGQLDSMLFGNGLTTKLDLILTSPTLRTFQTAEIIKEKNSPDCEIIKLPALRKIPIKNYAEWNELKNEFERVAAVEKWFNGEIPESIVMPYRKMSSLLLREIFEFINSRKAKTTLVVTHDHVIRFLSPLILDGVPSKVRYLDGFVIGTKNLEEKLLSLNEQAGN